MERVNTFVKLYDYINNLTSIDELLNSKFIHIEIQESLFRLFAKLECIEKLKNYKICIGNFNTQTVKINIDLYNLFFINNNEILLKDNGDVSDLTMISNDNNTLLVSTSKNYKKKTISYKDLELERIIQKLNNYNYKKYQICICIRDKNQYFNYKPKKTSMDNNLYKYLHDLIIIDHDDLKNAFIVFKNKYSNIQLNNLFNINKIIYRPHQQYTIDKTIKYFNESLTNILWGHIPRSGKTYIMMGLIEKLNLDDDILIITTAPNETITQYFNILINLQNFNIIKYDKKSILTDKKNVIIVSKQYLDHKLNKKKAFNNIKLIFIDESHNGATTDNSKLILSKYPDAKKVFITATFNKINLNYKIDKVITWDLEDLKLSKSNNITELDNKYLEISKYFNKESYKNYLIYPDLHIIGIDLNNEIRNNINLQNLNWNFETLFELIDYERTFLHDIIDPHKYDKSKKFVNESIIKYYFDYILTDIIPKIDENHKNYQRLIYNNNDPSVIMCFLPSNNINIISYNIKKLLSNYDIEICICNTTDNNNNVKDNINNSIISAKHHNKKCVLVLTGTQGSLGITIDKCDLVLLMNNSKSVDFLFQSMFRSMSEHNNKKTGYVIDLNIERIIYGIISYCNYKNLTQKEQIRHIINNDIFKISFNDDFMHYNKNYIIDKIYKYYNEHSFKYIDYELNKLENKTIILSKEQYNKIKQFLFTNNKKSVKTEIINDNKDNNTVKLDNNKTNIKESQQNNDSKKNYIFTLKSVLPLLCILTINNELITYNGMINYIKSKIELYNILINQFNTWWNSNMSKEEFNDLTNIFNELNLEQDKELLNIIETIKNLFIQCKNNSKELSKLVEKYLIPQEIEKKKNAEVSTPVALCKEMLQPLIKEIKEVFKESDGKINRIFKIFEPCSGKGIFLLEIVEFLIDNSTLTKKQILEECIYFADINPLNIFISKMLLDPNNKYKLNYYEGDTLQLDIKKEWDLEGFDAVIGNPPYQESNIKSNKSIGGTNLYSKFINFGFKLLYPKGYLLYVTPYSFIGPSNNKQTGNNILHNIFLKYDVLIFNINECARHFNVGSTFCYYLIKNDITEIDTKIISSHKKEVTIENLNLKSLYSFKFLPIHINNKTIDLINKITTNGVNKLIIERCRKLDTSRKNNNHLSLIKTEVYKYITYHTISKTYYSDIKTDIYHNKKIILNMSGYLKPEIVYDCNLTESKFYININCDIEANKLINLLTSTEIKLYLEICKYSGFNSRPVLESIRY